MSENIESPAIKDIYRQANLLHGLYERKDEIRKLIEKANEKTKLRNIFAYGCGDGFMAAEALTDSFKPIDSINYQHASSLEFILSVSKCLPPNSLAIPISMSGNVDRTIEATKCANEKNATVLSITNTSENTLMSMSDFSFVLGLQKSSPFLNGTVTYTASLMALALISLEWHNLFGNQDVTAEYKYLDQVFTYLSDKIKSLENKAQQMVNLYHDAPVVHILGSTYNSATAKYGAAKFCEITGTTALHQDVEEFAHSYMWQLQKEDLVIIMSESKEQSEYALNSEAVLRDFGAKVILIANDDDIQNEENRIILPNISNIWSPILFGIPFQFISYYWAIKDGLDPNTRVHLKGNVERFMASRRLTRKSLLDENGYPIEI